ncbi:hypothetical protein [Hydrogenophaga sp. ZJX-1]|uniref:hypothetical protein n=1 Tax=Hydrogenophaga sp. ZJX-1 TaxID=3404778 RepID=UPI003B28C9DE
MKENTKSGAASRRKRSAAEPKNLMTLAAGPVPEQVLVELKRRVLEIEVGYREVAQKMGQLYMYADQQGLAFLTRSLDRPMRNAADNERAMVSILDELRVTSSRRLTGNN